MNKSDGETMKIILYFCLILIVVICASCQSLNGEGFRASGNNQSQEMILKAVSFDESKVVAGQTIYVPIYSHIYFENNKSHLDLTATLSIRNTDLNNSLILTAVRYYDSKGSLVREYLKDPSELSALASVAFVVERTDSAGGSGANFIVEWVTEKSVSEPVVEAVMISAESAQGISFISEGRVIKKRVFNK